MRYGFAPTILIAVCCLMPAVPLALAQQVDPFALFFGQAPAEGASEPAVQPPPAAPVEFKPEMILLEDPRTGQLKQLIGFSLQDFEELNNLKTQRDALRQPPKYSFQSLHIDGTGRLRHAALAIKFVVLANEAGWVKVPLRLNEASLVAAPRHDGPGKFFLEIDDGGGLTAWLDNRGLDAEQTAVRHELSLDVLVPLEQVAGESRLKLSLPAVPESSLRMTVPIPLAVAIGSDGVAGVQSSAIDDRQTEFIGTGLKPEFELNWRESGDRSGSPVGVLEAIGEVMVRIDGHTIHSLAELKLKDSAAFSQIRVRLPQGARLVSGDEPGYAIEAVDAGDGHNRPLVEIRVFEPDTTATVRLVTERSVSQSSELMDLAGFEVLDAVRQWGRIAVAVDEQWQAAWGPRSQVRQLESLPDSLEREGLAARFEYSAQPYQLAARVIARRTQVAVEPHYKVNVRPDRMDLEATLSYTIRRAKAFGLPIDLAGWRLVEDGAAIGPDTVVDADQVLPVDAGFLTIPLKSATSGRVEIVLRATREIAAGDRSIDFELPRPDADFVATGLLQVQPAANIDLTPMVAQSRGLSHLARPVDDSALAADPAPLAYHVEGPAPRFVGEFDVRPQTIAVRATSHVHLGTTEHRVEQTLAYDVAHQPVDALQLLVPRGMADSPESGSLRVSLDGANLTPAPMVDNAPSPTGPVRMSFPLGGGQIGRFNIDISYTVGPLGAPIVPDTPCDIPLLMPADGQLVGNALTVSTEPDVNVMVTSKADSPWHEVDEAGLNSAPPAEIRLSCDERSVLAQLVLAAATADAGATIIDRAWIETHWTGQQRHDRAVYRFTTRRPLVAVQLPAGANSAALRATLDGQLVDVRINVDRLVRLPVSENGQSGSSHVLQLEYRCEGVDAAGGRLRLAAPRWEDATWLRQTYWQLVLPANRHVIWGPEDHVHEFTWQWNNFFWARTPLMTQEQLESWSGASQSGLAGEPPNRYLYSQLAGVGELRVQTAGRSTVVLFSSAASLLAGLALLYIPVCRRPACLLIAAVATMATATVFPEPAILFVQAGGLGLVLAGGALAADRWVARRRGPRMMIQGSSGSNHALGSTRRHVAPAAAGSHSSTKATALSLPAASESNV